MGDADRRFHTCSLDTCQHERFELVHRLPNTAARRLVWLEAISQPGLEKLLYTRICARHFRPEDYVNAESRCLNRNAVPSLNLRELNALDACKSIASYTIYEQSASDPEDTQSEEDKNVYITNALKRSRELAEEQTLSIESNTSNACPKIKKESNGDSDDDDDDKDAEDIVTSKADIRKQIIELEASLMGTDTDEIASLFSDEEFLEDVHPNAALNNIPGITFTGRDIIIQHRNYSKPMHLDILWLRLQCECEHCLDFTSNTRKCTITDVPLSTIPSTIRLFAEDLQVGWSDTHASSYSLAELYRQLYAEEPDIISNQVPWIASDPSLTTDCQPICYNDLICSTETTNTALYRLQRSGVLLITDITADIKQKPVLVELLLRRLFPHNNQSVLREERSDFHNFTLPHTNCSFLSESCGLQILTLSAQNLAQDVEIACVDGLNAAIELRANSLRKFDFLAKFKQPLNYRSSENFDYYTESSIIQLCSRTNKIQRIRYAPYQHAPMVKGSFIKLSDSLRKLTKIVEKKQHQCTLSLRNDTLVILDNWRILWQAKNAVEKATDMANSKLILDCIYVERKYFLSRLHSLQLHN